MRTNYLLLCCCFLLAACTTLSAQEVKFGDLDASTMDAAHYPENSAYLNYLDANDPERERKIKVFYGRPKKKGREVFGGLEPWGKDWRLGANEATEVTFYQAVEIGGTYVPAGTYTMFAQLYPNQWIIKISSERFIGGAENRDISKDLVAVAIPTETVSTPREIFTIGFQKIDDNNVHMVYAWDRTRAALPINLNPAVLANDMDDASPMDLVQHPNMSRLRNYVKAEELAANEPQVRVVYSRPKAKGRKVFGEMLPYGKMWRLGANETTEITFFKDVVIGGKEIRAGRYGLFAKVNEGSWDFIIHRNVQSWGEANHDEKDNVVTVTAKTEKTPEMVEALSMTFVEKGDVLELVVGWENTMARLPIKVKK